jgi:2-iminobutanoate/2-iminopropanoate deaminase
MRQVVRSPKSAPPAGIYSAGMRVDNVLYVAIQGPYDTQLERLGSTFAEQVHATLDNLAAVAREGGSGLEHAVRLNVFLKRLEDFPDLDAVLAERLTEPYPVRTAMLTLREEQPFDVSIDGIFHIPEGA